MTLLRTDNRLAYPGPRPVARDGMGNGRAHWDWFYDLPTREQNRLRYHMSPDGLQPDEWAHTNGYDDVEAAMSYWRGLVSEARSEWDQEEPEPVDGFMPRLIECDDDEWQYVCDQLARRRAYGVQATAGVVDHALPDEPEPEPITVPKSLSLMGCNDLAALVGVKPNTIVQWCRRGKMPAPSEIMGGRRYWVRAVALEWAESLRALSVR